MDHAMEVFGLPTVVLEKKEGKNMATLHQQILMGVRRRRKIQDFWSLDLPREEDMSDGSRTFGKDNLSGF
jgi:hypothetical protein